MTPHARILAGNLRNLLWLRVTGKGSHEICPGLKCFATERIDEGARHFVVDLETCPAMDSTFMGTLTGIAVHRDVAMTGEVTLRGRVLPIGGLKEKLLAALRGGIKTVLIPQENEKDLADIPANIKEGLEIIPVSHVDQVLARALVSPLVAVEWTEADELSAALPSTVGGENGASVTH